MRIFIAGGEMARPPSARTAYVDARAGELRHVDVELSHCFGNRTARQFRGDTATAICLRFAEARGSADLAVNDHNDVDGVLALLALRDSELALGHRRTLMQAAEMGDFSSWGDPPAQELYQGLSLFLAGAHGDPTLVAARAIEKARSLLVAGPRPELAARLRALRRQALEMGEGTWARAERLTLGEGLRGRGFPVAAGFLRDGAPAASTVKPDQVAQILSAVF